MVNGDCEAWSDGDQYWQVPSDEGDAAIPTIGNRLQLTEYFYNRNQ